MEDQVHTVAPENNAGPVAGKQPDPVEPTAAQPADGAAPAEPTTAPVPPLAKSFTVKLFQSHWSRSNTETFTVNADTAEEAEQQVRDQELANKDLVTDTEHKWDLEVTENVSTPTPPADQTPPVDPTAGTVELGQGPVAPVEPAAPTDPA